MRKMEVWLGTLLWAAAAILMPMAALEPVTPALAAPRGALAATATCPDGGASLAMGCESMHL
jgi:hypothetical protein